MTEIYDPPLSQIITAAIDRLWAELEAQAPVMAGQVRPWMESLAGGRPPEVYFKHPLAFPALLLPWWLEKTIRPEPDRSFQAGLAYSTINGYYFIRLIDNLMDGHATVELKLLPALGFFHTRFQGAYQPYFPYPHPFWELLQATWSASAEAAVRDAGLADIDRALFLEVAAKKVCASRIPIAAACYRYERPELIEPWFRFVDRLGAWHQLLNDLFDWQKDLKLGARTYFLCEGDRRRDQATPVAAWVIREGFEWGMALLQAWLAGLKAEAGQLQSPDLLAYLDEREAHLNQKRDEVRPGFQSLARLLALKTVD